MGIVGRCVMHGARWLCVGKHVVCTGMHGVGVGGRVAGILSVLVPTDVLQGEGYALVRGILDILRRRRHETLAQHQADRDGRLVKPSESVRGRRSGRVKSDLGSCWLVVVWRHSGGRGMG